MGNRIRKRGVRGGERGQALVEFAIIIPILLAVLLGIVEFARAWQIQQVVTNAAREGARVSVIATATDAQVVAAINTYCASAGLDMSQVAMSYTPNPGVSGTPDTVTVSYNYTYGLFGPVMNLLGSGGSTPGSVNLTSTAIMRNE